MKTPIDKSKNIIPKVKVSSPVHKIPIVVAKKSSLETGTLPEESLKQLFARLLKPIVLARNDEVEPLKYDKRFLSLLTKAAFIQFNYLIENKKSMPNKSKALQKKRDIKFLELKQEYPNVSISRCITKENLICLKRFYLINKALKNTKNLSEKEKINIVKNLVKSNPSIFNNE
jgi:hypothetical protein